VYSPADPFATAMVVVDGRVGWVGSEGAADAAAGPGVRVEHLDGALVTPAFVDAHVHLTDTGLALGGIDLRGARSATELLDAVAAAARHRPGVPLTGHGWDEESWTDRRLPTRSEIDRAAGGAVAYLARVDVHSALVSQPLVDLVPDVADADGFHPIGPVSRAANHRLRRASRDTLTPAQRRTLQAEALAAAARVGVGQVHEMGAPHVAGLGDLEVLLRWTASDPTVGDVVGYWGELGGVEAASQAGARGCAGDLCIDGSLGSRSAALQVAYADAPSTAGVTYIDQDQASEHVIACTLAGMQAGFHVIGDRAVQIAMSAIEAAAQQCGRAAVQACRHRLEHVEMVDGSLVEQMAALGVVASVQPAFDAEWGGPEGMYASRLGAQRAQTLNPFSAFARAGVTLAFGSDSPVTPFAPWEGVRAAAFHHQPEHRMTARGAFAAHTRGGWRAAGVDDAGVLVPGAPASYAVWETAGPLVVQTPDERVAAWSTDPRSGVPGLPDLREGLPVPTCRRTVVRGRTVYDAAA
jgi:predicted amidohydrolase YtcJ